MHPSVSRSIILSVRSTSPNTHTAHCYSQHCSLRLSEKHCSLLFFMISIQATQPYTSPSQSTT